MNQPNAPATQSRAQIHLEPVSLTNESDLSNVPGQPGDLLAVINGGAPQLYFYTTYWVLIL